MKLYLARHGEAVSEGMDPERPLSDQGRADVQRVAAFLGEAGIRVGRILHSGKKRAEQTAELLAESVGNRQCIEEIGGIKPLDPTTPFAQTVNEWTDDTMVVGHLPFMGRLVSRLVVSDEMVPSVLFRSSTVVCLDRADDGTWAIDWILPPVLLAHTGHG